MRKKKVRIAALTLFTIICFRANCQTSVNYGSNNGKYISINNTRIYFEEYGKGVPLLLLHGGLGSINDFQKVIPELSKHYRVIAADRPAHGRSEHADSLSYQLMADYTSKMIDLLKDFFADITNPILENKGNIYQYVGDEIVVAWNYENGIENLQYLRCFFDMKLHIHKNREKYLQRYGLVPTFKAGIHCGRVIAGEVGIIKRDITYSGDVLNTTSRILSKCTEFNEEVIVSSDLVTVLHLIKDYIAQPLGAIKLKGKENEVVLHSLVPIIK